MTLISQYIINNYQLIIIDILTLTSIVSGIFVIITRNPVVSVLYLIVLFVNVSLYLIAIGIKFIGLVYILVYVGAIAILFLYIIMLLNIKISEIQSEKTSPAPLGLIITILFLYPLGKVISQTDNISTKINEDISYIYQPNWELNQVSLEDIQTIGNIMYTDYAVLLILISLILLLAMVGSIIITMKTRYTD